MPRRAIASPRCAWRLLYVTPVRRRCARGVRGARHERGRHAVLCSSGKLKHAPPMTHTIGGACFSLPFVFPSQHRSAWCMPTLRNPPFPAKTKEPSLFYVAHPGARRRAPACAMLVSNARPGDHRNRADGNQRHRRRCRQVRAHHCLVRMPSRRSTLRPASAHGPARQARAASLKGNG